MKIPEKKGLVLSMVLVASIFILGSCVKTTPSVTFNMTNGSGVIFHIKPHAVTGNYSLDTEITKANIDSALQANGAPGWNVNSFTVSSATVTIFKPANGNLNDFSTMNFFISTPPSQPEISIASVNAVGNDTNGVNLSVTSSDVTSYIAGNVNVRIRMSGILVRPVIADEYLRLNIIYLVKATKIIPK